MHINVFSRAAKLVHPRSGLGNRIPVATMTVDLRSKRFYYREGDDGEYLR